MIASPQFQDLLQREVLGNPVQQWAISLGITIVAWIVLGAARSMLARRAGGYLAQRSQSAAAFVGRLLQHTSWLLVFVVSLWIGAQTYMDTHQAINLAIGRRFAELGVEFAYPTQTILMSRAATA